MQWLLTAYVRRYRTYYETSGQVWQGRFKAFPIEQDDHLLTVLRYIEQNPVRANLVARVEAWRWSSARVWGESVSTEIVLVEVKGKNDPRFRIWKDMVEEHHYLHIAKLYGQ